MKKLFVLATLLLQTLVLADESQSHDQMGAPDNSLTFGAMLQSFNYPDRYVGYRDYLGEITNIQSELNGGQANFKLVPGLADANKVSFESVNQPGYYLRHQGWRVKLHKSDGTPLFRDDATFSRVPGLADASWYSFESHNYPGKFLRHRNFHLWVEREETKLFREDATFMPLTKSVSVQPVDGAAYTLERANYWGGEIAVLRNWFDKQECARLCDENASCVVASYHDQTAGADYANTCVHRNKVGPHHPEQTNVYSWVKPSLYRVENRWGGINAPWHDGGDWMLGGWHDQRVTSISIESADNGASLHGFVTYEREEPIGFRAIATGSNQYSVENQWDGDWHDGGSWTVGGRQGQNVVKLNISSSDSGITFVGDMTYEREGPISFRASSLSAKNIGGSPTDVGVYDTSGNRILHREGELVFDNSGHEYYYDNTWERTSKDGGVMMVYHFNQRRWEWVEGVPMKKSPLLADRVDKDSIRRIYEEHGGTFTTPEQGSYPILTLRDGNFVNEFGEPVYSLIGNLPEWSQIILFHHYYEQVYLSDAIVEINARRAVAADIFASSNSLAVDVFNWGTNYESRRKKKKIIYFTAVEGEIFVLNEEQIKRIKNGWLVLNEKPLLGSGSPVVIPEASFYLSKGKANKRGVQGVGSDSVVLELRAKPENMIELREAMYQ